MSTIISEYELAQVHNAAAILLKNLSSKITIPELSRLVRLDEKKLKSGFKSVYGKSIKSYLRQHRLERAKELLKENKPLKLIARATGYKESTSLIKAFRKQIGTSPAAWKRNSNGQSVNDIITEQLHQINPDWTGISPD